MVRAVVYLLFAQIAEAASQFDGTWKREWQNTTPRGVHQVGSRTLDIRASGISKELLKLTLTQTISGETKTLRLVQSAKAIRTDIKAEVLTIAWSALQLLSPPRSEIPAGLHLWEAPSTFSYALRGSELLEIAGKSVQSFHRIAP